MAIVHRTQTFMAIKKEVMFTMIVMMAKRIMIIKEATVNEIAQVNEMLSIGFSGNLESITCMINLLHLEMKA